MPLDLHVLSLPLAFILSQDQTLRLRWRGLPRRSLDLGASPRALPSGRAARPSRNRLVVDWLFLAPQYPVLKVPAGPLGPLRSGLPPKREEICYPPASPLSRTFFQVLGSFFSEGFRLPLQLPRELLPFREVRPALSSSAEHV